MTPRRTLIAFGILAVFLLVAGQGCRVTSEAAKNASQPVALEWWRVGEAEDTISDIVAAYQLRRPHVTIKYRQLRLEEYERELLNAWAEGKGPDIFSVQNTWVGGYAQKLLPLPETVTMPEIVPTGPSCGRQQTKTVLRRYRTMRPQEVGAVFVRAVENDAVRDNKILALPLAVDTMVLYYNRDLLDRAGIPTPPRTWEELLTASKKLTIFNERGEIVQAGAAIGRADNVDRASDILTLLMMQGGAVMIEDGAVRFHQPHRLDSSVNPGLRALRFYTDFANPVKESYSWNEDQPQSLDAFVQGRTAFFFGYALHKPLIQARAPKMNVGVAPVPQLNPDNPVNSANYWLEGVFSRTEYPHEAWDFVQFATSRDQVGSYLAAAQKPTALRELVATQLEDAALSPFVASVLSAQSWYTGKDGIAMEQIMKDTIQQANDGALRLDEILNRAAERLQRTL